jgi:hypothetical protein
LAERAEEGRWLPKSPITINGPAKNDCAHECPGNPVPKQMAGKVAENSTGYGRDYQFIHLIHVYEEVRPQI